MRSMIKLIVFGFGLSLGGMFGYILLTNPTILVMVGLVLMFLLGSLTVGGLLAWHNKQWINGVFQRGNSTTNNRFGLPSQPIIVQSPPQLPPGAGSYQGPQVVEFPPISASEIDNSNNPFA